MNIRSLAFAFLLPSTALVLAAEQPGQTDKEPATKLEAFQVQTGTVVIKGYSEIGKMAGLGTIEVNSMEFTDATSGKKQSGVVIEIKESGRLENTNRSFIDYDEVDSLLKGLHYISKATPDVTKLSQFEATYKTKGYFSATTFSNRSGKIDAAVKCGNYRPANAFLSLQQLGELRALIEQAKQKLDSIK
ncbi:MAG TPA: hypothetical protein VIM41_06430 [Gammaproteobacteria bacterium]